MPGYAIYVTFYLYVTGGTPVDVVVRLHKEAVAVFNEKTVADQLAKAGFPVETNTPGEAQAELRNDYERFRKTIQAAGLKLEN